MPNNAQNAREAGLVSGVSLNHSQPFNNQDYNEFDRSADMFETQRFAEINPIYAQEFNGDDVIPIRSLHDLRSYTLKSPLMSDIYMNRSFFQVPLACMYPHTWEIFYKPQLKGNEIPNDAKPRFPLLHFNCSNAAVQSFSKMISNVWTSGFTSQLTSTVVFKSLLVFISVFSKDGLLAKLGYGMKDYGADDIMSGIIGNDLSAGITVSFSTPSNPSKSWTFKSSNGKTLSENRYMFMQLLYGKYDILSVTMADPSSTTSQFYDDVKSICVTNLPTFDDVEINLEKVFAYQLTCSQFFTNPYVDDITTAKKWLLNNESLAYSLISSFTTFYFDLNGVRYQYDLISYKVLANIMSLTFSVSSSVSETQHLLGLNILSNLFEVHSSLRYSDYFTDSRTRPLAVGDAYASVVGSQVQAIDMNRALWYQRFLNAVGRVPDNIRSYARSIFGTEPDCLDCQPMLISKERFLISGQEIENTSSTDQGAVVTNLRSSQSNFQFETKINEASIIIGLNSYSVKYAYSMAVDKGFESFDRYDKFNPFLQHIGDQTVLFHELSNDKSNPAYFNTFGYQVRYAQYKTALSHATGGFVAGAYQYAKPALASWCALFDKTNAVEYNEINTEFVRNQNIDFDEFFGSLLGTNLNTYFHFICRFTTLVNVRSRQQKFPSLL